MHMVMCGSNRVSRWCSLFPANTNRRPTVGLMLGNFQNHRRSCSINPLTSRPGCMPGSRYTGVGALFFRHLKLELLTQFPASNDEKYINVVYI